MLEKVKYRNTCIPGRREKAEYGTRNYAGGRRIEPPSSYQNATPGSNRPHGYIRRVRRPNRPVRAITRQFILAEHRPPFARAATTTPSTRRTNATLTDENRLSRGCLSDISSVSHDAWTRSAGRLAGYDRCSHPGRFIAPPEPPLELTFAPPPLQRCRASGGQQHPMPDVAVVSASPGRALSGPNSRSGRRHRSVEINRVGTLSGTPRPPPPIRGRELRTRLMSAWGSFGLSVTP